MWRCRLFDYSTYIPLCVHWHGGQSLRWLVPNYAVWFGLVGCICQYRYVIGVVGIGNCFCGVPSASSLTSIAAKIYNTLLRNRIEPKIDNILKKNQNGFHRNRSTPSQILTIRRILEGVRAKNLQATLLFVDFTKAFDSIHRRNMEQILLAYEYKCKSSIWYEITKNSWYAIKLNHEKKVDDNSQCVTPGKWYRPIICVKKRKKKRTRQHCDLR